MTVWPLAASGGWPLARGKLHSDSVNAQRMRPYVPGARFIQKVECQIQEHSRTFLGGKQNFSRTFSARHPHISFTILSTESILLVKQSRSQKLVL